MRVLSSITNRIFIASTLLATLSIGAAVYFVSARMTRETEAELERDLAAAATLVDDQRRTQFDNVARIASLIADLPRFKAGVDIGDLPTLEPIARDYQQKSGADLLIVTGRHGEILVVAGDQAMHAALTDAPGVKLAPDGSVASAFWPHQNGVLEVVSVPVPLGVERPELLGILSLGYLLDDHRAAQFKALTGADIAFAIGGSVRASTLGSDNRSGLAALVSRPRSPRILIGTDEYVALTQPLGEGIGSNQPVAIILRSRSERMRTLGSIQAALGGIALGAVLLAVAVSYGVARTITRPLASITDHMRQVAATGDLRKISTKGRGSWDDEDAHTLATTFNTLTDSIAKFQREAGQRERLSSLGRLSTVIAHEVRNPLMIIKGALRTLAADGATVADVRDAAGDIDEEIDRLNRLVNDVLDVARPIHFDSVATDINAVCRDAAAAATASTARTAVALELAAALPALVTDAERLRTVLVNLLTNAQHAVDAYRQHPGGPAGDAPAPPVRLITERINDRRVAITVRDSGIGIGEDDLPRIFDPYFTTRRAGTGLGLAIAKNIVEALGGSIGVTTQRGRGTDFRVELGDAPA
ncbi:MAG: ATP-binding protein [Vicinamibacterales bacterium]